MMELGSNQIAQILPHRYPFALVDRILDFESGRWARGIKCVSVNEPFFCGHFPQEHVMPGVLILEALAQVGAARWVSLRARRRWERKRPARRSSFLPLSKNEIDVFPQSCYTRGNH